MAMSVGSCATWLLFLGLLNHQATSGLFIANGGSRVIHVVLEGLPCPADGLHMQRARKPKSHLVGSTSPSVRRKGESAGRISRGSGWTTSTKFQGVGGEGAQHVGPECCDRSTGESPHKIASRAPLFVSKFLNDPHFNGELLPSNWRADCGIPCYGVLSPLLLKRRRRFEIQPATVARLLVGHPSSRTNQRWETVCKVAPGRYRVNVSRTLIVREANFRTAVLLWGSFQLGFAKVSQLSIRS